MVLHGVTSVQLDASGTADVDTARYRRYISNTALYMLYALYDRRGCALYYCPGVLLNVLHGVSYVGVALCALCWYCMVYSLLIL